MVKEKGKRKKEKGLHWNEPGNEEKMTIQEEINKWKKERDAVILAHYYVEPDVQEMADYIGDSFYLSKVAAGLSNRTLVFAGVSFMGESAKLLNPDKAVLLPELEADCPMAHMVTKEEIEKVRAEYEDLAVVCYINSTVEVKSWCDVSVTSANAVKIVKNLPNRNVLFVPDQNLGRYVAEQVPEKNVMLVSGYCPVHHFMEADDIQALREAHPEAQVLAHPECGQSLLALADYIGSTSGILNYAARSEKKEFIIATENGVRYMLEKENPGKNFYFPEKEPVCANMKKITTEKILHVLKTGENEAQIPEETAVAARRTLERMLELAR